MKQLNTEPEKEPKTKPGKEWTPSEDKRKKIARLLADGDKSFTELHKKLSWSETTLTNCLDYMCDDEHSARRVKKKPKAKREIYSLNKSHPEVANWLKWSLPLHPNLPQPDEEGFINSWRNSLDFCFVALLNDLTVTANWADKKKVKDVKQGDIGDYVEMLNVHCDILLERLKTGYFKAEKLREIQSKIHAQVKRRFSTEARALKPRRKKK